MTSSMTLNHTKIDNNIILTSLTCETTCKLIKGVPGLHLLISSLLVSPLRMHVESLVMPRDSKSILEALPGKLGIKRHPPSILYI